MNKNIVVIIICLLLAMCIYASGNSENNNPINISFISYGDAVNYYVNDQNTSIDTNMVTGLSSSDSITIKLFDSKKDLSYNHVILKDQQTNISILSVPIENNIAKIPLTNILPGRYRVELEIDHIYETISVENISGDCSWYYDGIRVSDNSSFRRIIGSSSKVSYSYNPEMFYVVERSVDGHNNAKVKNVPTNENTSLREEEFLETAGSD